MPGIVITVGGRNDGSLKRALEQDLAASKAAGLQIQANLRSQITAQEGKLAAIRKTSILPVGFIGPRQMSPAEIGITENIERQKLKLRLMGSTQATAIERARLAASIKVEEEQMAANKIAMDSIIARETEAGIALAAEQDAELVKRMETEAEKLAVEKKALAERMAMNKAAWLSGQAQWNAIQGEQTATMLANFEKQRVATAALKAEQLAMLTTIAATGGTASSFGTGHGGGLTGIIRETLVIAREISMGRGTGRIGGSITLLAQYLGILRFAVKSTAAESVVAAAAQDKLASSMAREALVAEASLATAKQSTTANAQNIMVLEAETVALREKALAQALVAKETNLAKEIQLAGAVTTLNPIFFGLAAAIVIVGAAAFFTWKHFRTLSIEAKNLADALNPLKKKFTELAEAEDKAAKAAQENVDWLKKLNDQHQTESDHLDRKIKLLRMEAEARRKTMEAHGASEAELQAFDLASLAAEKNMLEAEKARLELESQKSQQIEKEASAADVKGITKNDTAQGVAKKTGEILDAAQDAQDASFGAHEIFKYQEIAKKNPNATVGEDEASYINFRQGSNVLTGNESMGEAIKKIQKVLDESAIDFKIGNKEYSISVNDAKKNFDAASAAAAKLAKDQKALDDVLENAKSTAKEKQDALVKVQGDLEDVNDRIGIKSTDPTVKRGERPEVTALERVGIGAGMPIMQSLAQKQIQATLETNRILNTMKIGSKTFPKTERPMNSGFDDIVGGTKFA